MGRHDHRLAAVLKGRSSLATGLYASTQVETPRGWVSMEDLSAGDLVMTRDHGALPILATQPERRAALWAVRFPEGALGNDEEAFLPPGQPVLIESAFALPYTGEARALVPAAALEGWRGICPHVQASAETILQMRFSLPALVPAGGLVVGVEGVDTAEVDLIRRLMARPGPATMPLAAARHLVAAMVAEETGVALRVQAALRPENRA